MRYPCLQYVSCKSYKNLFDHIYYTFITGLISCNGQDGTINVGGASGGSIKLSTGTLNGKGVIKSNGGKGRKLIFSTVKVIFTSFKFQKIFIKLNFRL